MDPVIVTRGDSPVILGFPHTGTHVPTDIAAGLNDEGLLLRDTDWHIERLYDGLLPGATTVRATFHRYVIDANRDPGGESLYPGQTTTALVPLTTFDDTPIWRPGHAPDAAEIARRSAAFHAPYHAALRTEMERVRDRHGIAVLFDCHSIRSVIPWLFDGTLPDFNIGTDLGRTCDPRLEKVIHDACLATGRTTVLNGRFRGGWTTRHYGRPDEGFHTIQMELAQASHLETETPPFALSPEKSAALRAQLAPMLGALAQTALTLSSNR